MKRQLQKQGLKKQLTYSQRQQRSMESPGQEEERKEDDEGGAGPSRGRKRSAAAAVAPLGTQRKKPRPAPQPPLPPPSALTSSSTRFFDLLSSSSSATPSTSSASRADEAELLYLEEKLGLAHSSSATQSKLRREMADDGLGDLFDLVEVIHTGLTPAERLRIARQEGLMEELTAADKEVATTTLRTPTPRTAPPKRLRDEREDDGEESGEGEEEGEEVGEEGDDSEMDPDDDDQLLPEPDEAEMRRYYEDDEAAEEEEEEEAEGEEPTVDDDADDWPADDGGEGEVDDAEKDMEGEEEGGKGEVHRKPTRDELYGFNAPLPQSLINFKQGQPLTSTPSSSGKYLPPHLRNKTFALPSSPFSSSPLPVTFLSTPPPDPVLLPLITGLLNRVTPSTIEPLTTSLLSLYTSHPRATVTSTLTHSLLTSLLTPTPRPPAYLLSTSGLLALLHFTSPHPTLAYLVEHLLLTLHSLLLTHSHPSPTSPPSLSTPSPTPLLSLLSHLLLFDIVSPSLLLDLLHSFTSPLTPLTLPLLTSTLSLIGPTLRRADPSSIKRVVEAIHRQARQWTGGGGQEGGEGEGGQGEGERVEYLLSLISDVKNNRMRGEGLMDAVGPVKRALVAAVKRRVGKRGGWDETRRLTFGYQDVLDIAEKGRWWVVGAAYKGKGGEEGEGGGPEKGGAGKVEGGGVGGGGGMGRVVDEKGEVDYIALARSLGYHSALDVRMFCLLTSSSDYLHCVEQLDKLRLHTGAQHRALVSIVLDCVRRSRHPNPYYTLVTLHLLQHVRPMRFTLQLALWDTFTALEGSGGGAGGGGRREGEARNVGRFAGGVVVGGGVHAPSVWALLKHVEWEGMGPTMQVVVWEMLSEMLGEEGEEKGEQRMRKAFAGGEREKGGGDKGGQGEEERRVRTGLLHFLDVVIATPQGKRAGSSQAERERDVRVQRMRQAIADEV